jgi:hypothetical protein
MSRNPEAPPLRIAVVLCLAALGCSSSLPTRYVIERDLSGYAFRRYQNSLDVDVPVEANPAQGHSAAYLHRAGKHVDIVTAFVTVYERPTALTAEVRQSLATLPGYKLLTEEHFGQHVWVLRAGSEPQYVVWPSGRFLVKLGAKSLPELPEGLAEAYAALYPSDLDEHGHARKDAASSGSAKQEQREESEPELPANLREGAPR